jgi:hypothetical protein
MFNLEFEDPFEVSGELWHAASEVGGGMVWIYSFREQLSQ